MLHHWSKTQPMCVIRDQNNGIEIITDYAHHPTEINALIEATRECEYQRILAIFQPHRYSRTYALKTEFASVLAKLDRVILVPVYSASERWIEGGDSKDIVSICHEKGWKHIHEHQQVDSAWQEMSHIMMKIDRNTARLQIRCLTIRNNVASTNAHASLMKQDRQSGHSDTPNSNQMNVFFRL